jgi:hypothetical protein
MSANPEVVDEMHVQHVGDASLVFRDVNLRST